MHTVELKAEQAERALSRLLAGTSDQSEVMQQIGEYLVKSTQDRFDAGESPEGVPWAPKSEATLASYARGLDPYSLKPLIKSGTMRRTIFSQSDATSALVGSNAIQAAVMQFGAEKGAFGTASNGSSIPWGDIPARPFLGLSDEDEEAIVTLVEDWLQGLAED